MSHQSVSLREANQNFSRLMAAVERGEVFAITRRGREVARLTPSTAATAAGVDSAVTGARVPAPQVAASIAAIPLADAALAERMRRLETMVDKLLSALSAPDKR